MTKQELGKGCDHPLETCFVFNEHAQSLINYGTARKIDFPDMVEILRDCEKQGLVHNVDNCTKNIRSLCNCCQCCCILLKSINRGESFGGSSSRYTVTSEIEICKACKNCIELCPTSARKLENSKVKVDLNNCIGCGLCVTACPEGVNAMVLRGEAAKIPDSFTSLYAKIGREALFSIIKKKLFRS
jgi:Pyruvate/2-oxoacid:ferredoxin oxidoreductase delta subunit